MQHACKHDLVHANGLAEVLGKKRIQNCRFQASSQQGSCSLLHALFLERTGMVAFMVH